MTTNSIDKQAFLIYKGFYEPIKPLSLEERGQLFTAIYEYQVNGVDVNDGYTSSVKMCFMFFKNQFELDRQKYNKVVERNKNNGLKGGRPKTQPNPNNPVGFQEPKKADKDKDNEKEKDKDKKNNLNSFVAFYDAYPKKVSKVSAEAAYSKAIKKVSHDVLMAGLEKYKTQLAINKTESKFIKQPATWLNQGCWEDSYEQQTQKVAHWN
jgi:hypothetical protein